MENNYIELTNHLDIIQSYSEFIKTYLIFVFEISEIPKIKNHFLNEIIIDKFTTSIIYMINKFVDNLTENINTIPNKLMKNLKFISVHILNLISSYNNYKSFQDSYSREDSIYNKTLSLKFYDFIQGYQPEFINRMGEIIYISNVDKYKKFINLIETKILKHIEIDDEDIPDEFLDPIMSTLIKNPMVIPNTNNTFMDKTVIYKYLMTENLNPFTREKLNTKMLDEFNSKPEIASLNNELKERIKLWVESYKQSKLSKQEMVKLETLEVSQSETIIEMKDKNFEVDDEGVDDGNDVDDRDEEDESGVDENDILLVMEQANVSRSRAVRALKNYDGDIIDAIMDLNTLATIATVDSTEEVIDEEEINSESVDNELQ